MHSRVRLIRWCACLLAFVMLLIFLLCAPFTLAYDLSGVTWDSVDPLGYYMENWVGIKTRTAFTYSIEDWNATDTPVNYQEDPANYKVYLCETEEPGVDWDGKCKIGYTGSRIDWATCMLNMYYTDDHAANKRRSVSGNELGHSLGLNHEDAAVLMNPYTSSRYDKYGVYTPQEDDINGVNAMYG